MEKSQDRLAEAERKGKHPASNQAWKSKLYGGSHFVAGKLLHASPRQSAAAPSRSPQAPTALEDGRTPPTWAAHGRENPPVRKARRVRARQPTDHPASLRHAAGRTALRSSAANRSTGRRLSCWRDRAQEKWILKTVPVLVVVHAPVATTVSAKTASASHAERVAVPVVQWAAASVPRDVSAKVPLPPNAAAASESSLALQALICIFDCQQECNLIVHLYICLCIFVAFRCENKLCGK
ncbi:Metallothionein [Podarcis lilfordi]|uniref:Metallothionein n=1 Tax=Podarcis lilfordi TaxID=74358 RepID=A0AA35KR39_9SAUR|nr:Metallothionein [Podarcis lilfordi]